MNGTELFAVLGLAIPSVTTAQPQETPPTFDVASVKLHAARNPLGTMMQELPGSIQYRKVYLIHCDPPGIRSGNATDPCAELDEH